MDATETPSGETNGETNGESFDASFEDGLASRLSLIEEQPLEKRAAAYTEVHDRLRDRLEGGDVPAAAHR
ncbi:hypothetical protein GCM10022381_00940 [Leifsonia kafniensis]|uniref:Uncharacterized protein n=1 Tax=Leifsonia kafniensis TaxID=475957 RepID=A0ABP7JZ37_9MICO